VAEAIQSIVDQDFEAFEFIVVDDGSADRTRSIVGTFDDPRIRFYENPGPHGVAEAMQYGVNQAGAGWIARMDADDVSYPSRLRRQLEIARSKPGCAAVRCQVRLIQSLGDGMERHVDWVNALIGPADVAAARFIESPVAHPGCMIDKEWLGRIGGYRRVPWAEDHDIWMRLLEAGGVVEGVPEVLLDWRDSSGRLTRADDRYGDEARMAMRCHYLARMPDVQERGVVIAGAGPIGKAISTGLRGLGVEVHGFFEVHPRRIGQRIHERPVRSSEEMDSCWRDAVLLGAVGVPGGRKRVRKLAEQGGRREGVDFWSVC
jgi:glycosyltransferase involved in cell wall biosynthesis